MDQPKRLTGPTPESGGTPQSASKLPKLAVDGQPHADRARTALGLDKPLEGPKAPSVSLPKGGGALKPIAEKFRANAATGTGGTSIPLPVTAARGLEPNLALSYDTGSGNGPYGHGWSLNLGSITRKTDRGLPRYLDRRDSDTFVLWDAEDLVPELDAGGDPLDRVVDEPDLESPPTPEDPWPQLTWRVRRYRPRVESSFLRIERWSLSDGSQSHWRVKDASNTLRIYGRTASARVAAPDSPDRVFQWLLERVIDERGNAMVVTYLQDGAAQLVGADRAALWNAARRERVGFTQTYPHRVCYGNATPYYPASGLPDDFLFELVFDWDTPGAATDVPIHDPTPDVGAFPIRPDAFSSHRSGFDVRTRWRCHRVVSYHRVDDADEPTALAASGEFVPVAAVVLTHDTASHLSKLVSATSVGFRTTGATTTALAAPATTFAYGTPALGEQVETLDTGDMNPMPRGIDGGLHRFVDLDGEGLAGVLTEQGGAWWYARNRTGPRAGGPPGPPKRPWFSAPARVRSLPSTAELASGAQLVDVDGDGRLELLSRQSGVAGTFARTEDGWGPFHPMRQTPNVDWADPNLRVVDLTGDGRADLLVTEHDVHRWWPGEGLDGFGDERRVQLALDEADAPRFVAGDSMEAIFLADMDGDGLVDVVRVRPGSVSWWPNLGYGRFGARIDMPGLPQLGERGAFEPWRVRFADVDGSGTSDLLYLGGERTVVAFNQSGNRFVVPEQNPLRGFPSVDTMTSVDVVDLLGDGTVCLVWSSQHEPDAGQPIRFVRLMPSGKPHLLERIQNGHGGETRLRYAPSTRFYVADREAGKPWATRLPFPVHVVERVEVRDHVRRHRSITRYAYHHGYYDTAERELRGFAMVEQWDAEPLFETDAEWFEEPDSEAQAWVEPALQRSWFHTGAWPGAAGLVESLRDTWWRPAAEDPAPDSLAPVVVGESTMFGADRREAHRALKGQPLRQEIWSQAAFETGGVPYALTHQQVEVRRLVPGRPGRHGVFAVVPRETVSLVWDGADAEDPRLAQQVVLEVDPDFLQPVRSVSLAYPRRSSVSGRTDEQAVGRGVVTQIDLAHDVAELTDATLRFPPTGEDDAPGWPATWRHGVPWQQRAWEAHRLDLPEDGSAVRATAWKAGPLADPELEGCAVIGDHEATPSGTEPVLRTLSREVVRYHGVVAGVPTGSALDLGELATPLLPHDRSMLALSDESVSSLLTPRAGWDGTERDAACAAGGHVRAEELDAVGDTPTFAWPPAENDDGWWAPSGSVSYESAGRFYVLSTATDPFGTVTSPTWDTYDLQPTRVAVDADGVAGLHIVDADVIDAQTRQVTRSIDPAGVARSVVLDALGRVTATVLEGLVVPPDRDGSLTPVVLDDADHPTTRFTHVFADEVAPGVWSPGYVHAKARKEHWTGTPSGTDDSAATWQETRVYIDGFGNELMTKAQAAPGPAPERDAETGELVFDEGLLVVSEADPRFIGTGRTVLDVKGNPVRVYEPFFSSTWDYEDEDEAVASGVYAELRYDPIGRVVETVHPDGTVERVGRSGWAETHFDRYDTLPSGAPPSTPTGHAWYDRTVDLEVSVDPTAPAWLQDEDAVDAAVAAAAASLAHRGTPTVAHLDPLGRPVREVRTLADTTSLVLVLDLDARGLPRSLTATFEVPDRDVSGIVPDTEFEAHTRTQELESTSWDLAGRPLRQRLNDADTSGSGGLRWALGAVDGQAVTRWSSRGHRFEHTYDGLRRPLRMSTTEESGPTTLVSDRVVYGEDQGSPTDLLWGKPWRVYDTAGQVEVSAYTPDGLPLNRTRVLWTGHDGLPDWGTASSPDETELESGVSYREDLTYDALGRVIQHRQPHEDTAARTWLTSAYDAGGRLLSMTARIPGTDPDDRDTDENGSDVSVLASATYNARGQRTSCTLGTGMSCLWEYDPRSFRATRVRSVRTSDSTVLQDLLYVYDAGGQVTDIFDRAQADVFFDNQRLAAHQHFVYDAWSRLIEASGREHESVSSGPPHQAPVQVLDPEAVDNGQALHAYTQTYLYDGLGNLLKQKTVGFTTRSLHYRYDPDSNRLTGTSASASALEDADGVAWLVPDSASTSRDGYVHDDAGNMLGMPHLHAMTWDAFDRLRTVQKTWSDATDRWFYVYDAAGERVRKVRVVGSDLVEERRYVGSFEVHRLFDSLGDVEDEVETVHVLADDGRVAMLETRTVDGGSAPMALDAVWRFQLSNALGSACVEVTGSGEVLSYEEFYPYGASSYWGEPSGSAVSRKRFRFTGMERDEETGLQRHGLRYYAPWLGRWASADPIGVKGGVNVFAYASGSPTGRVDPAGTIDDQVEHAPYAPSTEDHAKARSELWEAAKFFGRAVVEGATAGVRIAAAALAFGMATDPFASASFPEANAALADVGSALVQPETDQLVAGVSLVAGGTQEALNAETKVEAALGAAKVLVGVGVVVTLAPGSKPAGVVADGAREGIEAAAERAVVREVDSPAMGGEFIDNGISADPDFFQVSRSVAAGGAENASVWGMKATERGRVIESALAKTDYKDWYNIGATNRGFFPLVDFQQGNTLVSLKTVDTAGSTWMGRMQSHIKDLGTMGATVDGSPASMVLDLRVQPGGAGAAVSLVQYGQKYGVTVIVKEHP